MLPPQKEKKGLLLEASPFAADAIPITSLVS